MPGANDTTDNQQNRPTVRLRHCSYQPSKSELDEKIVIRKPDGPIPSLEELARIAFRPMNLVEDPPS